MAEFIEREIKIEMINNSIYDCDPLPVLLAPLIAEMGKMWGTARRTALEYLNELVTQHQIFIDGDNVWTFDRWIKIEKARKLDYKQMSDILHNSFQSKL